MRKIHLILLIILVGGFFGEGCTLMRPLAESGVQELKTALKEHQDEIAKMGAETAVKVGAAVKDTIEQKVDQRITGMETKLEAQGVKIEKLDTIEGTVSEIASNYKEVGFGGSGAMLLVYVMNQIRKERRRKKEKNNTA